MSVLGVEGAMRRIRPKLGDRVEQRAFDGRDIAVELHETAPRGGESINAHGQPRSAPGEQPAIEHGDLREVMLNEFTFDERTLTASFPVNYIVLEYGYDVGARSRISDKATLSAGRLDPRPMGRMTSDKLKQEVKG